MKYYIRDKDFFHLWKKEEKKFQHFSFFDKDGQDYLDNHDYLDDEDGEDNPLEQDDQTYQDIHLF